MQGAERADGKGRSGIGECGGIFAHLSARMEQGLDSMLVTIIETSGSVPRGAGASMAVGAEGRSYGTIGGGALEYQAILTAREAVGAQDADPQSFIMEYNLQNTEAAGLGMVCGGSARVLFSYVCAGREADRRLAENGVRAAASGEPYWLLLPVGAGTAEIMEERGGSLRKGEATLTEEDSQTILVADGAEYYAERFAGDGSVYLFGGGHLAQETVPLLAHLGFRCIVADDRKEFASPERFPGAVQTELVDFKDLNSHFRIRKEDYLLVMTRGHLCDTDVERFALRTPAGYIGVVGSARKAAHVRAGLAEEGFADEDLDRIITPVGLDIGSETPAEIAVSIAGQLIRVRAGKKEKRKHTGKQM